MKNFPFLTFQGKFASLALMVHNEFQIFIGTFLSLITGGPGSGKGTQSLKIAERYGFEYISVGELLRKKIHNTSSNRKWSLIAKIITTGELAPQVNHYWKIIC